MKVIYSALRWRLILVPLPKLIPSIASNDQVFIFSMPMPMKISPNRENQLAKFKMVPQLEG